MVIEGPVHVAARAGDRKQRCNRCSAELVGQNYGDGELVIERHSANNEEDVIRLEPVSRSSMGTVYLCGEEPPAAFI